MINPGLRNNQDKVIANLKKVNARNPKTNKHSDLYGTRMTVNLFGFSLNYFSDLFILLKHRFAQRAYTRPIVNYGINCIS